MSEQTEHAPEPREESHDGARLETGNDAVDAVLASLDDLAGRPVGEHVAVFEAAHEQLRAALTGAAEHGGAPRPGPR